MAFAQLTYHESRCDIEACLGSLKGKLYRLGFRGKVARSTLSDANESRDWRICADFAHRLIATARRLYIRERMAVDLDESPYALDSTTIDLCLGTVSLGSVPAVQGGGQDAHAAGPARQHPPFICVTDSKVHDVNLLDEILPETGAFCVMDRSYIDFAHLFVLALSSASFVVAPSRRFCSNAATRIQ